MSLFNRLACIVLLFLSAAALRAGILEERAMEDAIKSSYVFREVLVDRGMVQLYIRGALVEVRGQAADEAERALILDLIESVVAPLRVQNRLFADSAYRRNTDRWRAAHLRSRLRMLAGVDAREVQVLVDGEGIVLRGNVPSAEQRALAGERVHNWSAGRVVRNELAVRPATAPFGRVDDPSVAAMVRFMLAEAGIDVSSVRVAVRDGLVALTGAVAHAQAREALVELAQSVRGVTQVVNETRSP